MKQMKCVLIAALAMAMASACVTDEQGLTEETSEAESATTTVQLPEEQPEDYRACWDAGLYWDPCGAVREMIPQHRQIDFLGEAVYCGGEWWYKSRHHATGHQGWVRAVAYCN